MPKTSPEIIADRYATAIFQLVKNPADPKVNGSAQKLLAALKQDTKLQELFLQSHDDADTSKKMAQNVIKIVPLEKPLDNALRLVAEQGRLHLTQSILEKLLEKLADARHEKTINIESAQTLDEKDKKKLIQTLEKIEKGSKVMLNVSINEDLIAGAVLTSGSLRIDTSVRGQLNHLSRRLTNQAPTS